MIQISTCKILTRNLINLVHGHQDFFFLLSVPLPLPERLLEKRVLVAPRSFPSYLTLLHLSFTTVFK